MPLVLVLVAFSQGDHKPGLTNRDIPYFFRFLPRTLLVVLVSKQNHHTDLVDRCFCIRQNQGRYISDHHHQKNRPRHP